MNGDRVWLPGSDRRPLTEGEVIGPVAAQTPVEVTVVLRRRAELPPEGVTGQPPGTISRADLAARFGADPDDVALVTGAVQDAGAHVREVDPASRRIRVAGTAADLGALFGVTLQRVRTKDPHGRSVEVRERSGQLSVPATLAGVVTAVLGLDDRPQARALFRVPAEAAGSTSYTPLDLARVYRMPDGTDGTGQTLAIIELGGGFGQSDLDTFFSELGLSTPAVTAVGVDGAVNTPGQAPQGADGEVLLDIEVAGAIAPAASVVVYFAPNTDAGFLDAVATAAHATPTPTAMSISWGQSEDTWTAQARTAMDQAFQDAAAMGVTVTAAAGDSGSSDTTPTGGTDLHVDFPASSPHVLACGGTSLIADPITGSVTSESVWNDGSGRGATGGGISDTFPVPRWQGSAGIPGLPAGGAARAATAGRGIPDVAAVADPATGYRVFVDGSAVVFGGTSAVAPLWAALVCRFAQSLGRPLGLLQPALYAGARPGVSPVGFRDITVGDNGHYQAATGWDPCTGLGVPDGTALLAALAAPAPTGH